MGTKVCPGCHFGCAIDDYQCARGALFLAKWEAGEEIPVRRPPWARGEKPAGETPDGQSASAHTPPPRLAALPVSARLMMLLTMAQNALAARDDEQRDRRVAECLLRQESSATNRIIAERTRLNDAAIDEQIASLEERGIVTSSTLKDGRTFHTLTEDGRAQAEAWFEEHKAADAAFFAELTDEEAEQLEALLAKTLSPFMRPGAHGK